MANENISTRDQLKKPYNSPQLIVHGSIEQLTLGAGGGFRDFFVYGINDPIGQPPQPGTGS